MTTETNQISIEEKVKNVICTTLGIDELPKTTRESALGSLGISSLDYIEIILRLEEHYDIDFDKFDTRFNNGDKGHSGKEVRVGQLVDYIKANYTGAIV